MRKPLIAGAALLALAASATPASASLIGGQSEALYLYPDVNTVLANGGVKTVANGTTYDFNDLNDLIGVAVSFSADQITVTNLNNRTFAFSNSSFDGVEVGYLPNLPPSGLLTSVTEDPASDPLFANGSVLTFPAENTVLLNLAGTCGECTGGEKIIIDATTTEGLAAPPIPEPASAALIGTGLLGLCLAIRRRSVG